MTDESYEPWIEGEINSLDDRSAMGLPKRYVAPRLGTFDAASAALREDPRAWLETVGSEHASLDARFLAGHLLGLAGDPRISTYDPPMVLVRGGSAILGTDARDVDAIYERYRRFGVKRNWIEKETPRFEDQFGPFRIAAYPVTNSEYEQFLLATGFEELPSSWLFGGAPLGSSNHPVYTVTPSAADTYAAWLSSVTGRRFRLPTEREWEYAATGGDGRAFPWGNVFDPQAANTMELRLLCTTPVGMFPRGMARCGAMDMAGNVEEYVADTYSPYPGGHLVKDDLYLALGRYRVARGGAFNRFADLARCQRRHGAYPKSLYAIGFRLAEDLP